MHVDLLKETFFSLVAPDLPNEWDVDEAVENLVGLDSHHCHSIMNQVPVIWPVSHSLCFDYLKAAPAALDCFDTSSLSLWVNRTLDQYEKNGLRVAQKFMTDVETNFLCPLRGESGLKFKDAERRLLPYLHGLSGGRLELAAGVDVWTDTTTVFVPSSLSYFRDQADNFFLYKLIVSYQWAFVTQGTLTVSPGCSVDEGKQAGRLDELWLQQYLASFSCPDMARDLYHLLETSRITRFLTNELPGLMRRQRELALDSEILPPAGQRDSGSLAVFRDLVLHHASSDRNWPHELRGCRAIVQAHQYAGTASDSIRATSELFPLLDKWGQQYVPLAPILYQGTLRLDEVRLARQARIADLEERFVDALATRILTSSTQGKEPSATEQEKGSASAARELDVALVVDGYADTQSEAADRTILLTVDNEMIEPGEELERLVDDIIAEVGYLPSRYVSSAAGRAGRGYAPLPGTEGHAGSELTAPVVYEEWDYRRGDFRKNWVIVQEKELPLLHSSFVQQALVRNRGQIIRLRRQFEMMRQAERFVRRQRDGEDIDLDAVVESLADAKAGLAPSDRQFIRLQRDERDIAVLFLIDMSNSTQGWVGRTIKESLVLLCEALEVVGDRYGIYGFSGMRRLRSEFFHIKGMDERYDEVVRQRIGSIAPREYTRMGPALRHATVLLSDVEARSRLLITLSDGKPEDYDDYKGEYAIEDTRHALLEARARGIYPFCITIDRQAHEYMGHMFGEKHYTLIDDVRKLPGRMAEMYRVLTR